MTRDQLEKDEREAVFLECAAAEGLDINDPADWPALSLLARELKWAGLI